MMLPEREQQQVFWMGWGEQHPEMTVGILPPALPRGGILA